MDLTNHRYNVNSVNVSKTKNNNDNVYPKNDKDNIADKLVEALNNPGGRLFYCKVAWRLSEAQIFNALELAMKSGRQPANYFSWLCKHQMDAQPVDKNTHN